MSQTDNRKAIGKGKRVSRGAGYGLTGRKGTTTVLLRGLRDCSLFMAKGGSVIFNQFRHMKNLPLPESGYLKKLPPPRLCDSFKNYRLVYMQKFRSGRLLEIK